MYPNDGLTIAIPNWNHELLLPRSVRSGLRAVAHLRDQGVPAELLVIDDGSRDGSLPLLRRLEARHHADGLRVLAFGANGGLAASRNQAIARGRYRYIAFVDADNEVVPENMPTFLTALRETGAAAAYGTLFVRPAAGSVGYRAISNESIQDKVFAGNYIDALAMFDRWQLTDIGGYEGSCPAWEDYALWLHLATSGRKAVFVPVVFGFYYHLPSSMITQTSDPDHARVLQSRIRRTFNQLGVRDRLPMATRTARYHPAFGYF